MIFSLLSEWTGSVHLPATTTQSGLPSKARATRAFSRGRRPGCAKCNLSGFWRSMCNALQSMASVAPIRTDTVAYQAEVPPESIYFGPSRGNAVRPSESGTGRGTERTDTRSWVKAAQAKKSSPGLSTTNRLGEMVPSLKSIARRFPERSSKASSSAFKGALSRARMPISPAAWRRRRAARSSWTKLRRSIPACKPSSSTSCRTATSRASAATTKSAWTRA